MKIRILPILLLVGIGVFGLTQSDPTQATTLKPNNPTVIAANPANFTLALATSTPAPATSASAEAKTPRLDPTPTQAATASATTLNTAEKIEKGVVLVGPAFQQFLEEEGAVGETPQDREAAEVDRVEKASQRVVAEQSSVDSAYDRFDLSRLRLANLLSNSDLHTASLDGSSGADPIKVSVQLNLGSSGVIPDASTKTLASTQSAPKLWPVKGPVTSTFGPRQTLTIPATTDNAAGKGGAHPDRQRRQSYHHPGYPAPDHHHRTCTHKPGDDRTNCPAKPTCYSDTRATVHNWTHPDSRTTADTNTTPDGNSHYLGDSDRFTDSHANRDPLSDRAGTDHQWHPPDGRHG